MADRDLETYPPLTGNRGDRLLAVARAFGVKNAQKLSYPALERLAGALRRLRHAPEAVREALRNLDDEAAA